MTSWDRVWTPSLPPAYLMIVLVLTISRFAVHCHAAVAPPPPPASPHATLPQLPHHVISASSLFPSLPSSFASTSLSSSPLSSNAADLPVLKVVNCSDQGLTAVPEHLLSDGEAGSIVLDLSHNQLDDLHNKLPVRFGDRIWQLDVSYNEIRQLGRSHVFANLTHVRHLILSGNHFKTLFAGVFRGMKRLESLVSRHGDLKYMDEHAFDGLENLRHLDLESNEIASIYLELFQSILNLHVSQAPASLPSLPPLPHKDHPISFLSNPLSGTKSPAFSLSPLCSLCLRSTRDERKGKGKEKETQAAKVKRGEEDDG